MVPKAENLTPGFLKYLHIFLIPWREAIFSVSPDKNPEAPRSPFTHFSITPSEGNCILQPTLLRTAWTFSRALILDSPLHPASTSFMRNQPKLVFLESILHTGPILHTDHPGHIVIFLFFHCPQMMSLHSSLPSAGPCYTGLSRTPLSLICLLLIVYKFLCVCAGLRAKLNLFSSVNSLHWLFYCNNPLLSKILNIFFNTSPPPYITIEGFSLFFFWFSLSWMSI